MGVSIRINYFGNINCFREYLKINSEESNLLNLYFYQLKPSSITPGQKLMDKPAWQADYEGFMGLKA